MFATITLAALLAAAGPSPIMQWSMQATPGGAVAFELRYRTVSTTGDDSDNDSSDYALADLEHTFRGLTQAQLFGPQTNVRFTISRQQGTISCAGYAKGGAAAGDFTFSLDPAFAANLRDRGVGAVSPELQRQWLFSNVDVYGMLDYFRSRGFATPSVQLLSTAIDHGVTVRYARDVAAAGISTHTIEQLVQAMDHGVSPRYLASAVAYGFSGLTLDRAIGLVDHGVSANYLAGLAKLGYRVTPEQAIEMVDHGVTVRYIERLRDSGYTHLTVADLVRLADQGMH